MKNNEFVINAPCAPSTFTSEKREKCLKILISAGGGVGGSLWEEFGTTKDVIENGGFIKLKDAVTQKEKTINTKFIVKYEEVTLVKSVWDTTSWANYNKKTCQKQTQTLYFWFPIGAKVSFTTQYINGNESIRNYLVKKIVDEE